MSATNIAIRRSEPDDYLALQAILSQPKAIWGTLQVPFTSAEHFKQRVKAPHTYGLVATVDGEIVGSLGLHLEHCSPRRRHAATLGMAVHDAWQGRGIGRALLDAAIGLADRWLNLSRLELTVYTDNAAAIGLYERSGFEIEGRLKHFAFRDGEYVDAFCMARVR